MLGILGRWSPGLRKQRDFALEEELPGGRGAQVVLANGRERSHRAVGTKSEAKRQDIHESLQAGSCVALSWKRRIRTLHHLGTCCAVPGVDCFEYEFFGSSLPSRAQFHHICQLSARKISTRMRMLTTPRTRQSHRLQLSSEFRTKS